MLSFLNISKYYFVVATLDLSLLLLHGIFLLLLLSKTNYPLLNVYTFVAIPAIGFLLISYILVP